jgi:hypothetical protein
MCNLALHAKKKNRDCKCLTIGVRWLVECRWEETRGKWRIFVICTLNTIMVIKTTWMSRPCNMHEEGHKYIENFNWRPEQTSWVMLRRQTNTKMNLKQGVRLWTGFNWLTLRTSCGFLHHVRKGISWPAEWTSMNLAVLTSCFPI